MKSNQQVIIVNYEYLQSLTTSKGEIPIFIIQKKVSGIKGMKARNKQCRVNIWGKKITICVLQKLFDNNYL